MGTNEETSIPRDHSVLDIPTVSVGAILQPLSQDDDLLGEMLDQQLQEPATTRGFAAGRTT